MFDLSGWTDLVNLRAPASTPLPNSLRALGEAIRLGRRSRATVIVTAGVGRALPWFPVPRRNGAPARRLRAAGLAARSARGPRSVPSCPPLRWQAPLEAASRRFDAEARGADGRVAREAPLDRRAPRGAVRRRR
jgi:hypothetical protein